MDENNCDKTTLCWVLIPCSSVIIVLSVLVIIFSISPPPRDLSRFYCEDEWIGYNRKCYYFSNETGNKSFAVDKCKSMRSTLSDIKSENELNFMIRYKEKDDYWIDLERENVNSSWISENGDGDVYSKVIEISGNGNCAFLKMKTVSSSSCNNNKKWICRIILPFN
ncbi:SWPV1-286 [Shearwaterpox virus]|uniref:SWPV1-286 n=1 Tax=Shearwaterpox virus TaxID=1974596 RepID=A0A1V0S895_CNPV|nr:SWPV1-286 [Shearwaterpox virus]